MATLQENTDLPDMQPPVPVSDKPGLAKRTGTAVFQAVKNATLGAAIGFAAGEVVKNVVAPGLETAINTVSSNMKANLTTAALSTPAVEASLSNDAAVQAALPPLNAALDRFTDALGTTADNLQRGGALHSPCAPAPDLSGAFSDLSNSAGGYFSAAFKNSQVQQAMQNASPSVAAINSVADQLTGAVQKAAAAAPGALAAAGGAATGLMAGAAGFADGGQRAETQAKTGQMWREYVEARKAVAQLAQGMGRENR